MKDFILKTINVLRAPSRSQRVYQALNKSPLRHLIKTIAIITNCHIYWRRRMKGHFELDAVQVKALNQLRNYGYAEVGDLVSLERLQQLYDYSTEKLDRAEEIRGQEVTKGKDFWVRLSDEDLGDRALSVENPMVALSIEEPLLKVVAEYLGQAPFLEYVLLTLSSFTGTNLKSSQLWHLDRDDTSMLKFFVYLTDVNSIEDGPFTFLDRKKSKKVKNGFFMRHLKDEEINCYVSEEQRIQMMRPKLSCFVVDTSRCYHMGSRLYPGRRRLMFTALFTALPSNYPWLGQEKISLGAMESSLSSLQRTALRV